MFFDDLIGNAILPAISGTQKDEDQTELTLVSTEGDNRKGGNGKITITTFPVPFAEDAETPQLSDKLVTKYLLRLGGITNKMDDILN